MMRAGLLLVLLAACGARVAVELPGESEPDAAACGVPCAAQIDCLSAGLVAPEPCQEWGCPPFGVCAGRCELGPIHEGQACYAAGAFGTCVETGGACVVDAGSEVE